MTWTSPAAIPLGSSSTDLPPVNPSTTVRLGLSDIIPSPPVTFEFVDDGISLHQQVFSYDTIDAPVTAVDPIAFTPSPSFRCGIDGYNLYIAVDKGLFEATSSTPIATDHRQSVSHRRAGGLGADVPLKDGAAIGAQPIRSNTRHTSMTSSRTSGRRISAFASRAWFATKRVGATSSPYAGTSADAEGA